MKSEDVCFLAGKLWQTFDKGLKQRDYSADKSPYSQSYGLPRGHIQLWELDCKKKKKRRSAEEMMPSSSGAGGDSWKFLGLQGDQTSQS